jgi:uncharacterized protein involved in outer membrane biogenesis
MKKIKKILAVSIIGLLALILIATIVIGLNLDRIVKLSVETVAPTITQTPVTLDSAGISLLTGSANIKGLVVGNPPGYQTPSAIRIDKAAISLSPGSLLSDKIVIRSIEIHAPEITFEGNPFGANNLAKILDNVNGTPDTNGPVRPGTNKPAKKLEVDDFLLAGAKVHVQLTGFANKELDLTLPDIHLVDLGKDNGGVTVVELTQKVLREVIQSTVKAVGKAAGSLSGKTVGKDVDKIKSGLGGLFNK